MPKQTVVLGVSTVILAAVLFSGWINERFSALESRNVESFDALIAHVRSGKSDEIHLRHTAIRDADLKRLIGLGRLRVLMLDNGRVTNDGMKSLRNLENLEHLKLRDSCIGDEGVEHLMALKNLRVINLPQATFSDESLVNLAELTKLELLRFGSPNVTDDGMESLIDYPSLRFLHVVSAPITDRTLATIEKLPNLESLYLDDCRVTDEGVSTLVSRRPDLHIHLHQRHVDSDPRRETHQH